VRLGAYRLAVSKLIRRFPDGVTGVALLLIRLSCAASAIAEVAPAWNPAKAPIGVIAGLSLSLALVAGALTRTAAILLAVKLLFDLSAASSEFAPLLVASSFTLAALLLLGPGAFSMDAHRYGRRVILLKPRSPDRGMRD
jgi:uncharacterized membrane protein YphA (DoxX/SURF4 family)